MVLEDWHHLLYTVTWLTGRVLVWQSSVTTVRAGRWWKDMEVTVVIHATFIILEPVCLSWRVSPESPHTVNSLSSMSVIIRCCFIITTFTDGGCHVILLKWRTGVEHLSGASAHAGWPTHVQIPVMDVTVIRMTMYGVKTAVSWLTRQSFQWNSSGLEILVVIPRKAITLWGNWSATA